MRKRRRATPGRGLVCWAWDVGDPRMIAGAADLIFVGEVTSGRHEMSESLRAEIAVDDSDGVVDVAHFEYKAEIRVLDTLKGQAEGLLDVTFPPELLLGKVDPVEAPVALRGDYVFAVTESEEATQLPVLPGCGVLRVGDPDDEARANAGLISDSRGRQHELMPVIELMRWAVSNAFPFKDGTPIVD